MRKITVISLFFCLTFVSLKGFGQQHTIDSLKKELTRDLPDKEKCYLANRLAVQYMEQEDIAKSLQYAYISLEFATRTQDAKSISSAYLRIGNTYSFANIYNTALSYYIKSKQLSESTGFLPGQAQTYLFMGETYNRLHKYDSAKICLDLANDYLARLDSSSLSRIILVFKGELEKNRQNYDTALYYYQKALTLCREVKDTNNMINVLLYMADLWEEKGNFQQEQEVLQERIRLSYLAGYQKDTYRSTIQLARCYIAADQPEKAYSLLPKIDSCISGLDDLKINKDAFLALSEYYKMNNNPEKAFHYFYKYLAAKDTIQNQYFQLVRNLFDIRYNTESKIQELELLKKNREIQNLKYQKNIFFKHIYEGFFFFLLSLLIVLSLGYIIKRRSHRQLVETNKKLKKINEELKKRKEKQQHENQVRNKLFMILAHDLINPFNALLGFAGLLSEEIQEFNRKDIKRHSEFIYQSSKQLHFLLENLLQWARIQTGRIKFMPAYFEINKLIRDVTETYYFTASKKDIAFTVDTEENMIVYADEGMITVVLRNLVHNAIKYTGKEGSITIKGIHENEKITLSVCDTGCGIQKEDMDKLFNLEFHFTQKGTSGEEGTGLGLIICKELLEIHHSTLGVESQPGKGSCFYFSLTQKKENHD